MSILSKLEEEFAYYSKRLSTEEWVELRTEEYWLADYMTKQEALEHKLKFIKHYYNKGVPLKLEDDGIHNKRF
jgi:hypothetical protein